MQIKYILFFNCKASAVMENIFNRTLENELYVPTVFNGLYNKAFFECILKHNLKILQPTADALSCNPIYAKRLGSKI